MLAQLPSHSKQEIEAVLAELDSAIAHKKEYQAARLVRADSIERVVNTCHPNVYVEKCKELYDAVADFDGKRSLKALARIEKTPQYQQDINLRAWTDLNASRTYGTMGLYHKANNITNPNKLSLGQELRLIEKINELLRLGYLVASPDLVNAVTTVKNSLNHFPVDYLTQQAGIAACRDAGYYAHGARLVAEERESFSAFLKEKGWEVIPSRTNFVFARKIDGASGKAKDGQGLYRAIKEKGILVRHFATPGIEDYLRITVGTHGQMQALREAMADL